MSQPVPARQVVLSLAARFGLSDVYPEAVEQESAALLAAPGLDDTALVDLRGLPFITIDNEDSRDLDQALHVAPHESGTGYLVSYALADASWYVRPASALFAEALARGASYYLPGYAVPMLPRALSEGIVSLNEGVDRRALTFRMQLDEGGACVATKVVRAKIRSAKKTSYDAVQAYYDHPESSALAGGPWQQSLALLEEVGQLRIAAARRRHVVEYRRRTVEIGFADQEGMTFSLAGDDRNDVERYNEQISLLCNMEGARILLQASPGDEALPIFRVHPAPAPERLADLATRFEAIASHHGLDPRRWCWSHDTGQPLGDYLEQLPGDHPQQKRLRMAIERQAMMANERSRFAPEVGRHYGIGAEAYARFSSPMREVVGIYTHREALTLLGESRKEPSSGDELLQADVVRASNRAKEIQRRLTAEANRLVLDRIFAQDLEPGRPLRRYRGTIVGLRKTRIYARLDEPPVEVKVYLDDIVVHSGVRYRLDESSIVLRPLGESTAPPLLLGDEISLKVVGRDETTGRWAFDIGKSAI